MMDMEIECIYCKKSFTQGGHLLRHIRKVHGENVHSWCKICKKTFTDETSRNEHVRFEHLKEGSVECKRCGRNLSWTYINRHLNKCTGNRLFYCLKCRFVYMSENDLKHHNEQSHEEISGQDE